MTAKVMIKLAKNNNIQDKGWQNKKITTKSKDKIEKSANVLTAGDMHAIERSTRVVENDENR